MMMIIFLCLFSLVTCQIGSISPNREEFCRQMYKTQIGGNNFRQFPTGPGIGWDNLQNLPRSEIFNVTSYEQCRLTADLQYLVFDGLKVTTVKTTRLDRFANFYESYQSYAESTSDSINVRASAGILNFQISGSFSEQSQRVKKLSLRSEKSSIFRTELEHHAYTGAVQPSTPLNENFKNRLREIGHALLMNQTKLGQYLSQLLVHDYGTHAITAVDVGVKMFQEDFVDSKSMSESKVDSFDVRAAAALSFFQIGGISASSGRQVTDELTKQYQKVLRHSRYSSYGGPSLNVLLSMNDTSTFQTTIDDLVVLDRSGVPLFTLISQDVAPDFPLPIVVGVQNCVKIATDEYYKRNTIFGCQQPDAENFNYKANVNDSTCQTPYNNYTFGGLYQTCRPANNDTPLDRCDGLMLKNGITGDFLCSPGLYVQKKLLDSVHSFSPRKKTFCTQHCESCGFLDLSTCCSTICNDVYYVDEVHIEAYWCSAGDHAPFDTGYLFGGLYTSKMANPFSPVGVDGCFGTFIPVTIGIDLRICISREYDTDFVDSIKFAGFFQCRDAVQHCSAGYTQHLAEIIDGCEIYYCVRPDALRQAQETKVVMPPFMTFPYQSESFSVLQSDPDGRLWHKSSVGKNGSWTIIRVLQENGSVPDDRYVLNAWNTQKNNGTPSTNLVCSPNFGFYYILGINSALVLVLICIIFVGILVIKRTLYRQHTSGFETLQTT